MHRRRFIASAMGWGIVGGGVCLNAGCGTVFLGERCGHPHSNQIDWKIAALDGLGLLLFFVPGVVAFVVDFSTGAIYLPAESALPEYGVPLQQPPAAMPAPVPPAPSAARSGAATTTSVAEVQRPAWQRFGLSRVVVSRERLQPQWIEQVVARHVGRPVRLDDDATRLSALASIDRFGEQARRHQSDRSFGVTLRDALGLASRPRAEAGGGAKAA
jgi:hypothetical protein